MINLNKLAREIAIEEVGEEVSIAQIKEIMRILFEKLSEERASDVLRVVEKYSSVYR